MLAYALWRRGIAAAVEAPRLQRLPRRLRGARRRDRRRVAALLDGGLGGWIYLQHQRPQRVPHDARQRARDWPTTRRRCSRYETVPQPRITDVKLDVDLYPDEPRAVTRGRYTIQNRTGEPLGEVHVRWLEPLEIDAPRGRRRHAAEGVRRLRLPDLSLRPAARARRDARRPFETLREQRGFRNTGNEQRHRRQRHVPRQHRDRADARHGPPGLLQDRAKRRKYGLPPELRPPKLEDQSAPRVQLLAPRQRLGQRRHHRHDRRRPGRRSPRATASQRRVANGRRTVRFAPRRRSTTSSRCSRRATRSARDRWKDVELAVYYDPAHAYNVERMLDGDEGIARLLHRPTSARTSSARCASWSSRRYARLRAGVRQHDPVFRRRSASSPTPAIPRRSTCVTYVTAHEIGAPVVGAPGDRRRQQGATHARRRSLAQYSALMVMEQMYGREQIRKFLKFELDRYLRSRGGEVLEELPLVRVEDQPYIHYQKGALVMYLLQGPGRRDERQRGAAQACSRNTRSSRRRTPTRATCCAACARTPVREHEQLITDLFEKITLYDVKVDRARSRDKRGRRPLGRHARASRRASCTRTARARRPRRRSTSRSTSACSRSSPVARATTRGSVLRSSARTSAAASRPCTMVDGQASRSSPASIRTTSASTATPTTT